MKKSVFIFLAIVLISFSCKKESGQDANNPGIEISKGDKYYFNEMVSVSLDSVANDSRCPSNANCIWIGNAEVRLTYIGQSGKIPITLNTNSSLGSHTIIDGYKIELVKLSPYPETEKIIEQKDYKAELHIERAAD